MNVLLPIYLWVKITRRQWQVRRFDKVWATR